MPNQKQVIDSHNQLLANFQQHSHTGIDSQKISFKNLSDNANISVQNIAVTSMTAYELLAGGVTNGNLQQVSGVGTSGQVLTSNGASALPTWQNTAQKVFGGSVNSSGTALSLPSGWSCGLNSTGVFTVTHTLGTSNYNVVASLMFGGANTIEVPYASLGTNDFGVNTYTLSGSASSAGFSFVLVLA
jgi:hypothetical protein